MRILGPSATFRPRPLIYQARTLGSARARAGSPTGLFTASLLGSGPTNLLLCPLTGFWRSAGFPLTRGSPAGCPMSPSQALGYQGARLVRFISFLVLGLELRTSQFAGECCATELNPGLRLCLKVGGVSREPTWPSPGPLPAGTGPFLVASLGPAAVFWGSSAPFLLSECFLRGSCWLPSVGPYSVRQAAPLSSPPRTPRARSGPRLLGADGAVGQEHPIPEPQCTQIGRGPERTGNPGRTRPLS